MNNSLINTKSKWTNDVWIHEDKWKSIMNE
jgi:hypothetical protein